MDKLAKISAFAGILLATSVLCASPASAFDGSKVDPFAKLQAAPTANLDDARAKGIDLHVKAEDNTNQSWNSVQTNSIGTNAMAGASGVFTVLQNSGNGAILQNVTTVEVNFH